MPGGPSSTLGSGPPSHFMGVQYATFRLLKRSNNLNVAYWTPMKCDGGPDPNVLDGPAGMTAAQQAAIPGCNSYWNPSAGRENPLYNDVNSSSPAYRPGGHWRVGDTTAGLTPRRRVSRRL